MYYFLNFQDPYLKIRRTENGKFVDIHTTEFLPNTLYPEWKSFTIPMQDLSGGDIENAKLSFECWDKDDLMKDELIGSFETTIPFLFTTKEFQIISNDPKKRKQKNYQNSGWLEVVSIKVIPPQDKPTNQSPHKGIFYRLNLNHLNINHLDKCYRFLLDVSSIL